MALLIIEPYSVKVEVKSNSTILHALLLAGIKIQSICGGFGACGKDRIVVTKGLKYLNPPTKCERKWLSEEELSKGYRLACQAKVIADGVVSIFIPMESRIRLGEMKAIVNGFMRKVKLEPMVRKVHVVLPKPSLKDLKSDYERLLEALKERGVSIHKVDLDVLRSLPHILRKSSWSVTAVLWGNELISIEPGDTRREVYGVAIDIGSSKITMHLVDLVSGKVIFHSFLENPQLAYGEDIVSRITYAISGKNKAEELHKLLINAINELINVAVKQVGIDARRIYEFVVVGNTAMHHFFLNLETRYVSQAPYPPVVRRTVIVKAKELGIIGNLGARVTVLPVIGGFVGADAIADALATGILKTEDEVLLLDIGTNTEIFVGNKHHMLVCSVPSGPALEGAQILFGMKAVYGAIESIKIYPDGEVEYKVINNAKPRGITGSAVIDAIAELYRNGFINSRGKFRKNLGLNRVRKGKYGYEYVIEWGKKTAIGKDIVITEKDISEVMLAKAAIRSGVSVLMKKLGIKENDLSNIYLAGTFGSRINPENAITIGMIPPVSVDKVKFVGNTAIAGADMALLSISSRKEAEEIKSKVRYVELSAEPDFKREYVNSLYLPYKEE